MARQRERDANRPRSQVWGSSIWKIECEPRRDRADRRERHRSRCIKRKDRKRRQGEPQKEMLEMQRPRKTSEKVKKAAAKQKKKEERNNE